MKIHARGRITTRANTTQASAVNASRQIDFGAEENKKYNLYAH